MHLTPRRTLALAAAILFLAVGGTAAAVPRMGGDNDGGAGVVVAAPAPRAAADNATPPAPPVDPDAVPESPDVAATTEGDTPPAPSSPTAEPEPTDATVTAAATAPEPEASPVAPKLAPGQRIDPTSAEVRAAITTLHKRIPLFQPTDGQLRTFADAVCTSFDQGQSQAQVESTVRDAVSRIQGQSLSAADAAFAVSTVVQLRCPGYLP